jgi:DNA-binding protein YbaB
VADYDQVIDELTAEYNKRRARTGELHRRLREISGTATAPRGTVKVTVGAQGEVRNIEFPTGAYKRMAPAELTAALMSAISEAKDKALAMVTEVMEPELPKGSKFLDIFTGKAELPSVLPSEPAMPDVVRDYLQHGRAGGTNG